MSVQLTGVPDESQNVTALTHEETCKSCRGDGLTYGLWCSPREEPCVVLCPECKGRGTLQVSSIDTTSKEGAA